MNRKQRRAETIHRRHIPVRTGLEWFSAGLALHQAGRLSESARLYRQALTLEPNHADSLHLLGVIAFQEGRFPQSLSLIGRAILLDPAQAVFHTHLGVALNDQGQIQQAIASHRQSLLLNAQQPAAHNNLGNALRQIWHLEESAAACRLSLILQPNFTDAWGNLALALQESGRVEEAEISSHHAIACHRDHLNAYCNWVLLQSYRMSVGLPEIARRTQDWNAVFARPVRPVWPDHKRSDQEKLLPRLGFVSGDFRNHAVGYLVIAILEALHQAGWPLTLYSNNAEKDALTERFQAASAVWRPILGVSDQALAEQIRADDIDILMDLSGFTAHNRLLCFARKPAPLQISWAGYPGSTGLAAMDYILADHHQIPPGSEPFYTEKIIRMPSSYIAFRDLPETQSIPPLPASSQGWITFGSFNVLKKISPLTVATWCRILQLVPNARLLMKNPAFSCAVTSQRYRHLFATHGIAADRLTFLARSTPAEHRAAMTRSDIALDSFPYSGGVTTLECLWMGVPVITLPGETFASRHSLGYLRSVGLEDLIARDIDHYVTLAVGLASDLERLTALRSGLRQQMLASPLCDVEDFVSHLKTALVTLWENGKAPSGVF